MNVVISTLNAKYIHTNLAIRYIKAYAQPEFDLEMAEYTINDPVMNIVTDLHRRKPDVIGFSCYIWNIEETIEVIQMLKKINPNLIIFIGGPEVTYDVTYWLKRVPEIDFIIIGEGEIAVKNLLFEIQGAQQFENLDGIGFIKADGTHVIKPQREKLNLKELPSPYRFPEDIPHLGKRITYIETSRGCPFSCQFCLSSIEVGVRYFDRERIKEDIRYLMKNGARIIKFVDRTFNISRSYAMEMFQFLIDEHVPGTVFQFEITADIMRPEVIEFLNTHAPAGLFRFEIGVQSTNDQTNDLVKRRQNFEKLTRTVTMVRDGQKIAQHLDLIAGLPEEDYQSFRKTFNDVFALGPEELQLGFLKLLRGTGLRIRANDHQYIYMDQAPYEMLGNNVLSFDDIIQIKQVEDVLEKYWNAHRIDNTVSYVISHTFDTPFDFFQEFGTYWDTQGWSRIGHQLEDLFQRLYQFLQSRKTAHLHMIKALLTIDYLQNHKYRPRKSWIAEQRKKEEVDSYYKMIMERPNILGDAFADLQLVEKDLYKHTIVEHIPFDYHHYMKHGEIISKPSILVAYYDPKTTQCELFAANIS
ncbi:B12-binding domain-containing radical SAM protein [Bacillus sp. AFS018417]|uniref:B12-binding domain-containing radical SAM protein n=1 Tax=Bacillus sp. AFS018417 TaxID=2033491 RepID=UPI000BF446AD|nr:B12-binding domain-containing radical SAM protein [Bacillus sp. AFS018417]PEZ01584.1 B12-binding domain-containing radical SAM protein [Bacillus sp. AFS018417]